MNRPARVEFYEDCPIWLLTWINTLPEDYADREGAD